MALGQYIKQARELRNLSVADLAALTGIDYQALSALEKRDSKSSAFTSVIAKSMGLASYDLLAGRVAIKSGTPAVAQNVVPVERGPTRPLISWVKAGLFESIEDVYAPGDGEDHIAPQGRSSKSAFWLRVEGDSMYDPGGAISFPDGCLILCDPELQPTLGQYCVAKDIEKQRATFKKLGGDAFQPTLVPLNRAYQPMPITETIRVIGRVIEWQSSGRL